VRSEQREALMVAIQTRIKGKDKRNDLFRSKCDFVLTNTELLEQKAKNMIDNCYFEH
jgi:hypothetical protein